MKTFIRKILSKFNRLGPAVVMVVTVLPIAGISLSIGTLILNSSVQAAWPVLSSHAVAELGNILHAIGNLILSNLGLIFAIGIALGFSDNDGYAALAAVLGYLVFNQTICTGIGLTTEIAEAEYELYTITLGIPTLQTGVVGGFSVGLLVSWLYRHLRDVKLPMAFSFFGGRKLVLLSVFLFSVFLGIIYIMIWPQMQSALSRLSVFVMSTNEPVAVVLYCFFCRLMVPFGLHHVIYPVCYFEFGRYVNLAGELVQGDMNIFFAQMADGVPITAGAFLTPSYITMGTLPAIALAVIREAKPENRGNVRSSMIPGIITVLIAGISEPIEFSYIATAFPLFILECLSYAVGGLVFSLLHVRVGTGFSGGILDYILYGVIPNTPNHWFVILYVVIDFAVIYTISRIMIQKLNLKTLGREDETPYLDLSDIDGYSRDLVSILGGKENIRYTETCATRLRCELRDVSRFRHDQLKGVAAAIVGNSIQIIYGTEVGRVKHHVDKILQGCDLDDWKQAEYLRGSIELPAADFGEGEERFVSSFTGQMIPLEEVPDIVFSGRMMGEGYAVIPEKGEIVSPVDGIVESIFPTQHAVCIRSVKGKEILIHVGINSAEIEKNGIHIRAKAGDSVKAGERIGRFDVKLLKEKALSEICVVVVTNPGAKEAELKVSGHVRAGEEDIVEFVEKV